MNSSLLEAIHTVLAAQSPDELERALSDARSAAASENAGADEVVLAVAAAVREKFRLSREIESLARIDRDTGLANRRAFDERLELELRRSARSRKSFGLVFIDLDEAQENRASHLREIASAISGQVRHIDFGARLSHRQFGVLLVDVDRSSAQAIAGRIQSALMLAKVPAATGLALSYPVDTAETLIERADAAVHEARFGR